MKNPRIVLKVLAASITLILIYPTSNVISAEQPQLIAETVAANLEIPWEIAFSPDGRIFLTERPGRLRIIADGVLKAESMAVPDVTHIGEGGLLGLALHPNFASNHHLYVYHTYRSGVTGVMNRVLRFTEKGGMLTDMAVILDGIPGGGIHNGGRIRFGPDEKLYVTTGDAGSRDSAQDMSSLAGKVLRINPDGSVPDDNPIPGSRVFTLGHRNPQGLDWHPVTGKLFESEHGQTAHDEVNILTAGENYGWPTVSGMARDPRFIDPLIETGEDTWAPSGIAFYRGGRFVDWRGRLFIATLRGVALRMVELKPPDYDSVSSISVILSGYGRLRTVAEGPDGYLYVLTNNRDGRGSPSAGDDRVIRIKPDPVEGGATTTTTATTSVITEAATPPLEFTYVAAAGVVAAVLVAIIAARRRR